MVKSFHYINVVCFCDAFFIFVWSILAMIQCMFVNVKLWRVKASLLQLSLSIHVYICLLLLVKCAIHDPWYLVSLSNVMLCNAVYSVMFVDII